MQGEGGSVPQGRKGNEDEDSGGNHNNQRPAANNVVADIQEGTIQIT